MADEELIEQTLKHLMRRREELQFSMAIHRKEMEFHQHELIGDEKELAKIEYALVGLKPLGKPSFWEKAGPAVGAGLALLAAVAIAAAANGQEVPEGTTTNLVLAIIHEGGRMTDVEILNRLNQTGWKTTSDNQLGLIRSYLSRLVQQGAIHRVAPSTYERVLPEPIAVGTSESQEA